MGGDIEKALESANITLNRQLIPGDIQVGRPYQNPGGLRIGTPEVTRLGRNDMTDVAEIITRIVVRKEDPKKVKQDVTEFRKNFRNVHYCFESTKTAYKYIKLPRIFWNEMVTKGSYYPSRNFSVSPPRFERTANIRAAVLPREVQ